MELKIILEFAIALTIAPLTFCWAIDLAHLIQAVHRGQFREFAETCTNKADTTVTTEADTTVTTETVQHHRPQPLYTSKAVKHYVAEGYPDKLGDIAGLYPAKKPVTEPLAYHLAALGLDKQLKDLTAIELRKLGARMKIKGAARGRKKEILKAIRGTHNYA